MPQTSVEELTARLLAATQGKSVDKHHACLIYLPPGSRVFNNEWAFIRNRDKVNVNRVFPDYNMVVITEVVSVLETMSITAEHLKVTRLGKHINTVRRQLGGTNKSLAKRMKKLVQAWQLLLQNRSSNGLPLTPTTSLAVPRSSTPTSLSRSASPLAPVARHSTSPVSPATRQELVSSPVKHDPNILTVRSSTPQPVNELFLRTENSAGGPLRSGGSSDPAKNRIKLLNLLSKVKKPQTQHPATTNQDGDSQNNSLTVQQHPVPGKSIQTVSIIVEEGSEVVEMSGTFSNINFDSVSEINEKKSLEVSVVPSSPSDPLTSLASNVEGKLTTASLSLPIRLPLESKQETPKRHGTTGNKSRKEQRRLKHAEETLVVSFPRNLVKSNSTFNHNFNFSNHSSSKTTTDDTNVGPQCEDLQSLMVSIPIYCLQQTPMTPRLKAKKHSWTNRAIQIGARSSPSGVVFTGHAQDNGVKRGPLTGKVLAKPEWIDDKMIAGEETVNGSDPPSASLPVPCVKDEHHTTREENGLVSSVVAMEGVDGAVSGVTGIVNRRGEWFSWTDAIPGSTDTTVTVLPYVFIDDVTELL